MAKAEQTMYFAIKLVASSVGDKAIRPHSVPSVNPTKHAYEVADSPSGSDSFLTIGGKQVTPFYGIGGHFTACVLDFSDAEDAACKTAAEAERLVTTKHKAWLADAYDWFVIPASVDSVAALARVAA